MNITTYVNYTCSNTSTQAIDTFDLPTEKVIHYRVHVTTGMYWGSGVGFTGSKGDKGDAVWNAESGKYTTANTMGHNANDVKNKAGLIPAAL